MQNWSEENKNIEIDTLITQLARGKPEDELILLLCKKYNLRWGDVKKMVEQVKEENAERIALRQLPVKSFIALALGVGGFALFVVSLFLLIDMVIVAHQVITFEGLNPRELFILPLFGSDMILPSLLNATDMIPSLLFLMIQGLAMVLGSAIGMRDYWQILIGRVAGVLWK